MISRKKKTPTEKVETVEVKEKPQSTSSSYLPVHVHSDFSIGDAILSVEEYVSWAEENKIDAICLTDHGSLCGSLIFNQKCLKAGIKPIIGLEAYCQFKSDFEDKQRKREHLVILAKSIKGYHNLLHIFGTAIREHFYYRPVVLYEDLFANKEDLIVTSACMAGRIPQKILADEEDKAIEFVELMKKEFGDDFYLEAIETQMDEQKIVNDWIFKNYKRLGVKGIWTTDTHYRNQDHIVAHDTVLAINRKFTRLDSDWDSKVYTARNLWLKTRKDIIEEVTGQYDVDIVNEFLDNTREIANKTKEYKLGTTETIMPNFATNSTEVLEEKVWAELKERGWDKRKGYPERVELELEVIKGKKMEDYFLIVQDIVKYAEANGIFSGAGRGSGAGSLVVCLLGITKIDPIKYQLYFERFLNPKRIDPPDIDLDFGEGRPKIEAYLKEKYGVESVAHVISFGRFGIKGAIRDVFRVYSRAEHKEYLDRVMKNVSNDEEDLDNAIETIVKVEGDAGGEAARKFFGEEHTEEMKVIRLIVNKCRHYSLHAGGVVITPGKVEDFIPIMRVRSEIVSAFPEGGDTRMITDSGLMKFDILGLKACTIIGDALALLKGKVDYEKDIIEKDDDPVVLKHFADGNTFSIFQFEGRNITSFVKKVIPKTFEDLVAVNALYRPGVIMSGGLDRYLENKEKWSEEREKDKFMNVLKETFGTLCYQEQVMNTFRELGGFTLAEADEARHTLKLLFKGKDDYTEFNKLMAKFKAGCQQTTDYEEKKMDEILDYVKKFAQYSFNKAHSCAYAMMGYIMMYLKTYHPAEYYSALLANTPNAVTVQDKIKVNQFRNFISKIQSTSDIRIKKPNVNDSAAVEFRIDGKFLRCALSKIKDVGEKAAVEIEAHQPYSSFKDFVSKVKLRTVNKRVIRALIYAEALNFPDAIEAFQKRYKEDIDMKNFMTKQFEYMSFIVRSDFKRVTKSQYSLKNLVGTVITRDEAVTLPVFVCNYRVHPTRYGLMRFASIYDGTDVIKDCVFNPDSSELKKLEDNLLIQGELTSKKAKNPRYGTHGYYLNNVKAITLSEDYVLTRILSHTEEPKPILKKISRKKKKIETEVLESKPIIKIRRKPKLGKYEHISKQIEKTPIGKIRRKKVHV